VEKSEVDQESVNQKKWMKKKHDDALNQKMENWPLHLG